MILLALMLALAAQPHEATVTVTLVCPPCETLPACKPSNEWSKMAICINGPKGAVRRTYVLYAEKEWYGHDPIDTTPFCVEYDTDEDSDVDLRDVAIWMNRLGDQK